MPPIGMSIVRSYVGLPQEGWNDGQHRRPLLDHPGDSATSPESQHQQRRSRRFRNFFHELAAAQMLETG